MSKHIRREVSIYVDGSCRSGKLGAGIILVDPLSGIRKQWAESFDEEGTSQDAEFLAILHGARKVVRDHDSMRLHLYSDSLYAIKSLTKGLTPARKHLGIIHQILEELSKFGEWTIHKIPAHVGHAGSDAVDKLARQGARRARFQIPLRIVDSSPLGGIWEVCGIGEHDRMDEVTV